MSSDKQKIDKVLETLREGTEAVHDNPSEENYQEWEGKIRDAGKSKSGIYLIISIVIGLIFFIAIASTNSTPPPTPTPIQPYVQVNPPEPTNLNSPSSSGNNPLNPPVPRSPTPLSPPPEQPTPVAVPAKQNNNFNCPDLNKVRLNIGDRARIAWDKVNLRSSPEVPQDFYKNIVVVLNKGDKLNIIGGPQCVHDGTWWEVQTDSGHTGWVREYVSTGYLLEPI